MIRIKTDSDFKMSERINVCFMMGENGSQNVAASLRNRLCIRLWAILLRYVHSRNVLVTTKAPPRKA